MTQLDSFTTSYPVRKGIVTLNYKKSLLEDSYGVYKLCEGGNVRFSKDISKDHHVTFHKEKKEGWVRLLKEIFSLDFDTLFDAYGEWSQPEQIWIGSNTFGAEVRKSGSQGMKYIFDKLSTGIEIDDIALSAFFYGRAWCRSHCSPIVYASFKEYKEEYEKFCHFLVGWRFEVTSQFLKNIAPEYAVPLLKKHNLENPRIKKFIREKVMVVK